MWYSSLLQHTLFTLLITLFVLGEQAYFCVKISYFMKEVQSAVNRDCTPV